MLGQIEVLLAFTAVMAAISLIIMVCNQIISSAFNLRGLSLRWGLAALFKNQFPEMMRSPKLPEGRKPFGDHIANAILVHPLISDSALPSRIPGFWRIAAAIRLEELQKVLSVLGSADKGNSRDVENWTNEDAISWLSRRTTLMGSWFGAVMDRVSQHFALYMRILTVIFAGVFVWVFHVDSISLYNGLNADTKLRNGVLSNIQAIQQAAEKLKNQPPGQQTAGPSSAEVQSSLDTINSAALVSVAQTLSDPLSVASKGATPFGQLITIALLSLGAPFWFNQLKNFSNLRSVVATKEEKERIAAASSTPSDKPKPLAIGESAETNIGEIL